MVKLNNKKQFLPLIAAMFMSPLATAEQCDVHFNYGVVIDPTHIRILDKSQTLVQINHESQLFVRGRELSLNEEQEALLAQYSSGIRKQIPEIVSIAIEGVNIGLKAVNTVIGGLTGENSASHQRIQQKFDELESRLRRRFNHSDDSFYIAPQDFDDFDELFAGQFDQEIEQVISQSIGAILMAVGEAMTHEDEGNIESRVNTFDEKMRTMGEDLEYQMANKANALENKAQQFCHDLLELDKVESKLHQSIPQLMIYNLIESENH